MSKATNSLKLVNLYADMAELTAPKCASCKAPWSCCSPEYCNMASTVAKDAGVELQETGHPRLKYMGKDGCVVPPHLRPLCTLHVCSINNIGFDANDPKFTKKYFSLRGKILRLEVLNNVGK